MTRWLAEKSGHTMAWLDRLSAGQRLLLVFGLSLLLRLLIVWSISLDPVRGMHIDSMGYLRPAQNMVLHGRFSAAETPPYDPETIRTPGYPAFLAVCIWVFGSLRPYLGIVFVQAILGAATSVSVTLLGQKLVSPRIGLTAGLVHSIAPIQALMVGWIMTEAVFTTFFVAGLMLYSAGLKRSRWWQFAGGGVLLGAASLIRPIGTWMLVPLALALVFEKGLAHKLRSGILLLAGYLLVIGPWMGRNYYYFGHAEITSVVDYHLYYFALPDYLARQDGISAQEAQALLDARLAEVPDLGDPWPVARQSVVVRQVMAENLPGFLLLNGIESLKGLVRPGFSFMQITLFVRDSHEVEAGMGLSWNSLADILDGLSRQSALVLAIEAYMLVFLWAMLILGAVGVFALIWQRRWSAAAILFLLPALMMYPPGLGSNARYRSSIEPLLILLMVVGAAWLAERLRQKSEQAASQAASAAPRSAG